MKIKYFNSTIQPEEIIDFLKKKVLGKKIYVSIDIDAIDPKYAPGVNYPEKEGLTKESFFEILKKIKSMLDVRVYDLVEVVLEKDKDDKTLKLAKEIVNVIIN